MSLIKNIGVITLILILISCKKREAIEPIATIQKIDFSINYKIDDKVFVKKQFNYKNQAGYDYSVTNLVYYLSQISLIKADGNLLKLKNYHYVDAEVPETNHLILDNVSVGNYIGLTFNIGLDSLQNRSDTLPVTPENINMQWPQPMGGGYHFMKLEGYYKDTSGTYGYAMHIGTNACLIPIRIDRSIIVSANTPISINLMMNINEWFRNPNVFDFNKDGNNIMGNIPAMKKIVANGVDVFSF